MSLAAAAQTYTSYTLFNDFTRQFIEPLGYIYPGEKDDAGTTYGDNNFWGFCVAGAGTVALYYAAPGNSGNDYPLKMTGSFIEPWGPHQERTYWNASDTDYLKGFQTYGRAYILYLADSVWPQNPQSAQFNSTVNGKVVNTPGIMDFTTYPMKGSNMAILTDALNWETSNHNVYGPWPNYFWDHVTSFGQTLLHNDVVNDIVNNGVPVVVSLDAQKLVRNGAYGNWKAPGKVIAHAITIIGYDDVAKTYKYVDTCGANCSGYYNGGVFTLTQTAMYNSVSALGGGYIA
jgi:hypothetical protein